MPLPSLFNIRYSSSTRMPHFLLVFFLLTCLHLLFWAVLHNPGPSRIFPFHLLTFSLSCSCDYLLTFIFWLPISFIFSVCGLCYRFALSLLPWCARLVGLRLLHISLCMYCIQLLEASSFSVLFLCSSVWYGWFEYVTCEVVWTVGWDQTWRHDIAQIQYPIEFIEAIKPIGQYLSSDPYSYSFVIDFSSFQQLPSFHRSEAFPPFTHDKSIKSIYPTLSL